MFGTKKQTAPAASAAVHVLKRGTKALCGTDLRGEPELPAGTRVTCPVCAQKNGCGPGCGCH